MELHVKEESHVKQAKVERRTFRWRDEKRAVSTAPPRALPDGLREAPYEVIFSADSSMYMAPQVLSSGYTGHYDFVKVCNFSSKISRNLPENPR